MIAAQNFRHVFADGLVSLEDLSFSVDEGEFVAIMGPSGCGKSTLLRLVAGLIAGHGSLLVSGKSPAAARRAEPVGFVFQSPTLLPWRSVSANVRLPLELTRRRADDVAIAQRIAEVGLGGFEESFPRQLSGGMRMRVALARALVLEPRLLLLDEPFAALDEITRQQLQDQLSEVWRRHRCTCVFVTHNVFEAVFLATRVLVMSARPGRIIAEKRIPFPETRSASLRGSPEFARVAAEILDAMKAL